MNLKEMIFINLQIFHSTSLKQELFKDIIPPQGSYFIKQMVQLEIIVGLYLRHADILMIMYSPKFFLIIFFITESDKKINDKANIIFQRFFFS